MGFGQAIKTCFDKYATFSGRARRAEFWFFYLFAQVVSVLGFALILVIALTVLPTSEGGDDPTAAEQALFFGAIGVVVIASLALVIPLYTAWARRLHDMGQSGHWLWLNLVSLGLVPLIMAIFDSEQGTNRWGHDPKAVERGPLGAYAPPGQVPGGYLPRQ
ncbi:DUF805 domain-containing protein [Demequina sp. SO4-13]|uniref:DUF805 domain-containing protein n=1 Tax=Demequina sp. SO4-13 TaxID=3401027 RepID=UPI003AF44E5A